MTCMVCESSVMKETAVIQGFTYGRCNDCGSISADRDITEAALTQNDNPDVRNTSLNNLIRIRRLDEALSRKPGKVLDYGCGQGELVKIMASQGIDAIGADIGSFGAMLDLNYNSIDAVTMIEVIEHLYSHDVFKLFADLLKPEGVIMIETTFADQIKELANHSYVDPGIGHVCIISRQGLHQVLPKTLTFDKEINSHVLLLRKKP